MAAPVVRVQGLDQLRRDLRRAGVDLADLKQAHTQIAELVAVRARALAPVGRGSRRRPPGRLAASIRGNKAVGRASVSAGRAKVRYAGPIHWGWPRRGIAAQPFLQDAGRAAEPEIVAAYSRDLQRIADSI